jgi:hypothetical protein
MPSLGHTTAAPRERKPTHRDEIKHVSRKRAENSSKPKTARQKTGMERSPTQRPMAPGNRTTTARTLQWWRRFVSVNLAEQIMHASAAESSTHSPLSACFLLRCLDSMVHPWLVAKQT